MLSFSCDATPLLERHVIIWYNSSHNLALIGGTRMPAPLTEREVDQLFQLLNAEQGSYLQGYLKQSKKSKWLEKLAWKKGIVLDAHTSIDEIWEQLNDWELKEILDGGYGNRPYKCECGMPLRFCYIVHHRKEKKTYRLGETCLGNYTLMSPELIKDITNGFHKIDLERDDILLKHQQGWELPSEYLGLLLPGDIQTQLDLGLPLSSSQMNKIEKTHQQELLQNRLKKQLDKVAQQRKSRSTSSDEFITLEEVLSRHLPMLKQILEHEDRMTSAEMLAKWSNVKQMIKDLKRGKPFDYSKFLLQMFELLYEMKLY
ncbi:hypothetical protein M6D81_17230 [Paenibacillus sp. J5C_2022]|uniref:hypothetical protein n=1 Tax=Paenibacillus sp. J5C2022 TaxID=2977129 RepID=UPI0021D2B8BA|nr:hypothetical protein [Paenibacillus sp. J5C2022]MCU6710438.1 hypothetical protein [Paenibacillus sp. J5C2022]